MNDFDFKFDDKKHVYTLDGKRLYGVTSVLGVIAKPALIQWSANQAVEYIEKYFEGLKDNSLPWPAILAAAYTDNLFKEARTAHRKKKEAAGDVGADVHAECEGLIKLAIPNGGKLTKNIVHGNQMVQKFINWAVENDVTFLASEKQMYSKEMWVAGTCDFTAKIGDKLFMGDIKTSSGIYGREYFFQCAGYILMAEEHGEKFDASIIVRLGKDGSFETKESHDLDTDKKGFRAALDLFKALETN